MLRQRGFAIEGWMVWAAIGFVALVGSMVGVQVYLEHIEKRGFDRGRAEVQAKWDAAELARVAHEAKERRSVANALDQEAAKRQEAEEAAQQYLAQLEEERRANRNRKPMASCTKPGPAAGGVAAAGPVAPADPGETAPAGDGGVVVQLHWRLVGLHDGAFTGLDGEPLFGPAAAYASDPARADTPSPYRLEHLEAVTHANALALSACRRDVAKARGLVMAAEAGWCKANPGRCQ